MESALSILIQASQREIYHNNNGLCPDEMEGYDSRDPYCVVCQAIDAAQGLQARYDLALSDVVRLTGELATEKSEVKRLFAVGNEFRDAWEANRFRAEAAESALAAERKEVERLRGELARIQPDLCCAVCAHNTDAETCRKCLSSIAQAALHPPQQEER